MRNDVAPVSVAAPPLVLRSDDRGIATLTLNRPQQFNAISMGMLDALQAALNGIAADSAADRTLGQGVGLLRIAEGAGTWATTVLGVAAPVLGEELKLAKSGAEFYNAASRDDVAGATVRGAKAAVSLGKLADMEGIKPVGQIVGGLDAADKLMRGDYGGATTAAYGAVGGPGAAIVQGAIDGTKKIYQGGREIDEMSRLGYAPVNAAGRRVEESDRRIEVLQQQLNDLAASLGASPVPVAPKK